MKTIIAGLTATVAATLLAGCGGNSTNDTAADTGIANEVILNENAGDDLIANDAGFANEADLATGDAMPNESIANVGEATSKGL